MHHYKFKSLVEEWQQQKMDPKVREFGKDNDNLEKNIFCVGRNGLVMILMIRHGGS